jgi:hypothetical protein
MNPAAQSRFDWLAALPRLTVRALGQSLLADDAVFRRIPAEARPTLVDAALSEGRVRAESVSRDFGSDPWTIAKRLGVSVVQSDSDAGFGNALVFAEYTAHPPQITLYHTAIAEMSERLSHPMLRGVLEAGDCKQVVLAHELYHHLERTGPEPLLRRRYRVTVLQLGRWRWTSGIAALEEIAAGAFAQTLLSLKFHPRLLELLCVLGGPALRP